MKLNRRAVTGLLRSPLPAPVIAAQDFPASRSASLSAWRRRRHRRHRALIAQRLTGSSGPMCTSRTSRRRFRSGLSRIDRRRGRRQHAVLHLHRHRSRAALDQGLPVRRANMTAVTEVGRGPFILTRARSSAFTASTTCRLCEEIRASSPLRPRRRHRLVLAERRAFAAGRGDQCRQCAYKGSAEALAICSADDRRQCSTPPRSRSRR